MEDGWHDWWIINFELIDLITMRNDHCHTYTCTTIYSFSKTWGKRGKMEKRKQAEAREPKAEHGIGRQTTPFPMQNQRNLVFSRFPRIPSAIDLVHPITPWDVDILPLYHPIIPVYPRRGCERSLGSLDEGAGNVALVLFPQTGITRNEHASKWSSGSKTICEKIIMQKRK